MGTLILSRRHGEGFSIGDNVNVRILSSKFGQVKIAIEAPTDVHILRDELKDVPFKLSKSGSHSGGNGRD